jgi:hypothetical protein
MGELRRLYYQTKEIGSFKTFKWVLKGRWNQGTGNSGSTRTYLQWDELGISYVGSDGVKYGPTYWTVDSYSSSGSLWSGRPASEMFDGEWGSETSKSDYKNINDTDGYVEIIIHTTSGEAIVPNGVGLISCSNQSSYESSTPGHFILYGLDESTNEYVQLIDVPAANVNKGKTKTTTVTFDPVEVVTGTYYLLAPSSISKGSGLRWEMPGKKFFYQYSESSSFTNKTIDLISLGMDPNATQRYLVFYQDVQSLYGSNNGDGWYYLQSDSYQFFRVFSRRLNATRYREAAVQSTGVGIGTTSNKYKIIYDRVDLTAKVYINGGLSFTGTVTEDPVTISKVTVGQSWATSICNNLAAAGFASLEDAEAWDGSPF